jgi:hypothetical protein
MYRTETSINQNHSSVHHFAAINYDLEKVCVVAFEKEKGGVGASGTAMSFIEACLHLGVPVTVIDLGGTQGDVGRPYKNMPGVSVYVDDVISDGWVEMTLRIIANAISGSYVAINFPGGTIEQIGRFHELVDFVQRQERIPMEFNAIWTMGEDLCSLDTLKAVVQQGVPGRLIVNYPEWAPKLDAGSELPAYVEEHGLQLISMPALNRDIYKKFSQALIAPKRLMEDADIASSSLHAFWVGKVLHVLGARS